MTSENFTAAHANATHFDVLIIGAGLSGIGAAHHLQTRCPGRSYAILEGRNRIGGTWDLFRYPGVRSDSDMYTLGYSFRPWEQPKAIADGPSILKYVQDTARDGGIEQHIRFGHQVKGASWSTAEARWTIDAEREDFSAPGQAAPTQEPVQFTCNFLFMCSGYYSYESGYTPDFPGRELAADLIVTATGLSLQVLGGLQITVDGARVDLAKTMNYKGLMHSGIPNLASSFGYTNASWTLKCDLTCEYVCRLLNYMAKHGYTQCTPRNADASITEQPWVDFSSGYLQRSMHLFPKQGSRAPWKLYQNYPKDVMLLRFGKIADGVMAFA